VAPGSDLPPPSPAAPAPDAPAAPMFDPNAVRPIRAPIAPLDQGPYSQFGRAV
jgi:hypothetical protein